jgi:hypothetical protein
MDVNSLLEKAVKLDIELSGLIDRIDKCADFYNHEKSEGINEIRLPPNLVDRRPSHLRPGSKYSSNSSTIAENTPITSPKANSLVSQAIEN